MSGDVDRESKTEEPTDHRLRTALDQGNIPISREVATFGPLAGSIVALLILSSGPVVALANALSGIVGHAAEWPLDTGREAMSLLEAMWWSTSLVIIPTVGILAIAGLASATVQNQPRIVADRILPKLSRISLRAGWERIFGAKGLVEFGKSLFKLCIATSVAAYYLSMGKAELLSTMLMEPTALPRVTLHACVTLFTIFVVMSIILVVADVFWVRFSWKRDLRMTREELKEEMKQLQGDPIVKGRLRSLARDRARRRMISSVSKATLVIANPTHFAVALRYVRSEGGAPLVLAKGKDLIALRIRQIAEDQGIPVVEDKPLARSLYDGVEAGKMIPPEFYRAVAKIILFLTARGKLAPSLVR